MNSEVLPLTFACAGAQLLGLLHRPERPKTRGVVIVPGAPQYRTGSHRQFTLLARELAAAGFPVLRFDYRGLGDSDGDYAGFEGIDDDIRAAVCAIFEQVPMLRDVVLCGLCDGASAISFYAPGDPRVSGVVLVNPWVRSEASLAQGRMRFYYRDQILSPAFWRRLARRQVDLAGSARDFVSTLRTVFARGTDKHADGGAGRDGPVRRLPLRVARSIGRFGGRVLVLLSGEDLTAQEFELAVLKSPMLGVWQGRPAVTIKRLEGANHTYASRAWRNQVHRWILEWLAQDLGRDVRETERGAAAGPG